MMVRTSHFLRSIGLLATIAIAALAVTAGSAHAQNTEWYVDVNAGPNGDGTGWATAFDNLDDALTNTSMQAGDSIWVAKGTYVPSIRTDPNTPRTESFVVPPFQNNGIQLLGGFDGTEQNESERDPEMNITILSGDLDGDDDYNNFVYHAQNHGDFQSPNDPNISDNAYHVVTAVDVDLNTRIDGFTIVGGNADGGGVHKHGGGIYCGHFDSATFGTPRIRACTFKYNRTDGNHAGAAINASHGLTYIRNCTFTQNFGTDVVKISRLDGFFASTLNLVDCVFDTKASDIAVLHEPGADCAEARPMTTNVVRCSFVHDSCTSTDTSERIEAMSHCGPWQR